VNRPAPHYQLINHTSSSITFDDRTLSLPGFTQREFLTDRKRLDVWTDAWSDIDAFNGADLRGGLVVREGAAS
jgi:hypothetical protein